MTDAIVVKQYRRGKLADWQYLVILDACRYDVFAEIARERGWDEPLKVDTQCHCTSWWYRKFWSREPPHDVHLISANPVPFSEWAWNAWRNFESAIWADPAGQAVKEQPELAAIIAEKCQPPLSYTLFAPIIALRIFQAVKQPGERYLIHLMPPHLPFLGSRGRALFKRLGLKVDKSRNIYKAIQSYGREGNWDEVRACYKENIEYALSHLATFWHLFADGKTVITSDHAEITGEASAVDGKGVYHHSHAIKKFPDLHEIQRIVPWFEARKGVTWRGPAGALRR